MTVDSEPEDEATDLAERAIDPDEADPDLDPFDEGSDDE